MRGVQAVGARHVDAAADARRDARLDGADLLRVQPFCVVSHSGVPLDDALQLGALPVVERQPQAAGPGEADVNARPLRQVRSQLRQQLVCQQRLVQQRVRRRDEQVHDGCRGARRGRHAADPTLLQQHHALAGPCQVIRQRTPHDAPTDDGDVRSACCGHRCPSLCLLTVRIGGGLIMTLPPRFVTRGCGSSAPPSGVVTVPRFPPLPAQGAGG